MMMLMSRLCLLGRTHHQSPSAASSILSRRRTCYVATTNAITYTSISNPRRRRPRQLLHRARHDAGVTVEYGAIYGIISTLRRGWLSSSSTATADSDRPDAPKEPTVEELYSRKTPLEHVLLRPGMYVGPNERLPPATCWVLNKAPPPPPPPPPLSSQTSNQLVVKDGVPQFSSTSNGSDEQQQQQEPLEIPQHAAPSSSLRMVQKEIGTVPALVKIFDEILVNASDNRLRHPKTCTRIDVLIDPGLPSKKQQGEEAAATRQPYIRVFNDGKGIPVQVHKKEGMHVPEMLFGHLLTGSNFDDSEKRLTGGRHGYGAKLTNIFSNAFTVETYDSKKKLKYRQTWSDNMTTCSEPEIIKIAATKAAQNKDYTCVSFVPDMARLTGDTDASAITDEDYAVMCRRVVDIAGCAAGKLTVTLNGLDVSLPSFAEYGDLFRHPDAPPVCYQNVNARWAVGVGLSETGSFETVSFCNGMATTRGGSHVNVVVQQVTRRIQERLGKLDAELAQLISPSLIRRHLFIACDALIENPTFDSQMKEYLTSNPSTFGSSYTLSAKLLSTVVKSTEDGGPGIVEELMRIARGRQQAKLLKEVGGKKSRRQILSIPKLDDAHLAGSDEGRACTLILTEGDSAKALAIAGLEVIGRAKYGVFPLRGKFLNVRDAAVSKLANNAEVKAMCSILGLDFDKEYDTKKERDTLRYGHVMLMTDQDADGSHIKGLVLNFFRYFWPQLLQPPRDQPLVEGNAKTTSFLSSFVTPLLKARKKGGKEALAFYSMSEYMSWRASLDPEDTKKWNIKYYKGLGTSTPIEAKEYFTAFDDHLRPFHWNSDLDGELLDMVFDKNRASDRRDWIRDEFDEDLDISVDPDNGNIVSFEDFVNKEMIHFSHGDNIRSIPSLIDGLKPSQRKVLYACFKRKLKSEVKVAQLTGYCAEHTAYHHGEASLQATIIGMAQDFAGSNNINLLVPSGQFGTRLEGGRDAASPRYIFTYLSPVARYLLPEDDDILLDYREDDGQLIEPEFYCPILPLVLINGSQGIGTGWSTTIPSHNPLDVYDYILAKINDASELPKIRPFARGLRGGGSFIDRKNGDGYISEGSCTKLSGTSLLIDELPLKCWTNDYKSHLLKMRDKGQVSSFVENHTTTKVSFTVNMKSATLARMGRTRGGLERAFNLYKNVLTSNMHAFDHRHQLVKFDTAEDVADAFFPVRRELYVKRKSVLESEMNWSATTLRNKARFIEAVANGEIDLMRGKQTKEKTITALGKIGLTTASQLQTIRNDNALVRERESTSIDTGDEAMDSNGTKEFDYLLSMPLSSLTTERISELRSEASKKDVGLQKIRSTTPEDLWRRDLERLRPLLVDFTSSDSLQK